VLIGQKVVLREKRIGDAEKDYAWRRDADLCLLDAVPTLDMPYNEYLGYYADELKYPTGRRRKFAVDTLAEGRHIGNCMYYDIDRDRRQAELGILIGDRDYWNQGYGTDAVETLVRHIFDDTAMGRVYLKTLEWNVRAQRCFLKCGFVNSGRTSQRGHDFLVMELHRPSVEGAAEDAAAAPVGPDERPHSPTLLD
jgi:RimJ/RimL family protein N-acetyltransferase